jgi:hypothetical protein
LITLFILFLIFYFFYFYFICLKVTGEENIAFYSAKVAQVEGHPGQEKKEDPSTLTTNKRYFCMLLPFIFGYVYSCLSVLLFSRQTLCNLSLQSRF